MEIAVKGVFPELVDQSAFVDTAKLSIWGRRRDSPLCAVRDVEKKPIASRRGKYGWVERGIIVGTGNRYELVFGPLRLQKIIPPLELVLRSDSTPITVEDAITAINALVELGDRVIVSQMELTFDLAGPGVEWFERRIFSSARRFRTLTDQKGYRTHYAGGPTSPWQLRVYQKTSDVVRFEYVLRRPFLRQRRISGPEDIALLRHLDFGGCVWLQRPNMCVLRAVKKNLDSDLRRRAFVSLFQTLPLREFVKVAEATFGAPRRDLVLLSAVDDRLRRMQRKLVC
jgi:hypothetical protein